MRPETQSQLRREGITESQMAEREQKLAGDRAEGSEYQHRPAKRPAARAESAAQAAEEVYGSEWRCIEHIFTILRHITFHIASILLNSAYKRDPDFRNAQILICMSIADSFRYTMDKSL